MEFIYRLIDNLGLASGMGMGMCAFMIAITFDSSNRYNRCKRNMLDSDADRKNKYLLRLARKIFAALFCIPLSLLLFFKNIEPVCGIGGYCVITSWIYQGSPEHKPLFDAIRNRDFAKVRELFVPGTERARDDKYKTPLHVALQGGDEEIILFLIKNSKNVNQRDGLFFTRYTPLHYAVFCGKEIMQELLNRGANISAEGYQLETPLEIACRFNLTDAALFLIGKDENLVKQSEFRLIYWSIRNNNLTLLKTAISHGFDVNKAIEGSQENGRKAIHLAAEFNRTDIISLLAANGADINVRYRKGRHESITPYKIAVESGSGEAARLLVKLGARETK
jgi:ankyrin repeat protein